MSEDILMGMERAADEPPNTPGLGVGFFIRPSQDKKKSKAVGHPVFYDREWVRIVVPGDKNSAIERPASERDKQRFPQSYARFKAQEQKAVVDGMPIEEWPQVTRAQAMTFKAANIFTVEMLAELSDSHVDKVGHWARELRAKAQAFLVVSKDTAAAQQFKAENDKLKAMLADQQRQIAELASRLQDQPERRGPGRPRKVDVGQGGGNVAA